jgi:hypothetical protein
MNAKTRLATLAAVFVSALQSASLILQSERPLPAGLDAAVEREFVATEAWESATSDVVVRIHGICRVPTPQRQKDSERPLGWVDIVDGQMLSIIHVDCTRIGEALERLVVNPHSIETREMYARAIARVIRHELRHVLLDSSDHEKRGENKAALRAEELAAPSSAAGATP